MQLTGRNQLARRFIHAPSFEWQPVEGASSYRISILRTRLLSSLRLGHFNRRRLLAVHCGNDFLLQVI